MGNFNGKGYGDKINVVTLNGKVYTTNACRLEDFAKIAGIENVDGNTVVSHALPQEYTKSQLTDVIFVHEGILPSSEAIFNELFAKGILTMNEINSVYNAPKIQLETPLDEKE